MADAPIDVNNFDDIRPYRDQEITPAIERILQEQAIYRMVKWVYPGLSKSAIQKMLREVKTVNQFQAELSGPAFKRIIETTTSGLTFTNMDAIERDKAYLFLSNHRDIILDSAFLNVSLIERGYQTTQIAIGDNLLRQKVVEDLVRANKNFIVNRNINPKDLFHYSLRLSNYIRRTICEDIDSIWIAQREGRSKDGDDRTATGLLKMFAMSSDLGVEEALLQLNIIPMAVSYEYDPCDILKTNELMHLRILGQYEKKPGEDFYSMITGITGHKGHVNIAVGDLLTDQILAMKQIQNKNEKYKFLTQAIDREMHRIYRLWPTNYMAYDLLNGTREFRDHYTNIQKISFSNYIRSNVLRLSINRRKTQLPREGFIRMAREIMLQMYANPVINKMNVDALENNGTRAVVNS